MSRKNRVILIGIDGASFPVTKRYLKHLPNIKRILKKGQGRTMLSPLPITPAAWTSIATGTDPTEHGVVDFVYMRPGHEVGLVNRTMRKKPAVWNILSDKGYKCIIINYPVTYPPEEINGLMVSGFLTPGTESDFVYPKNKKKKITSLCKEYRIFIREPFTGDGKKFVRDIIEVDSSKGDLALRSMDDMEWDFLALVFMGLDHVQHMFWHQMDESHPRHSPAKEDPILKVYRSIDAYLGKIMHKAPDASVVIVSDHGFGPLHYYVDMNRFLGRKGYLKYPFSLFKIQRRWEDIDWKKTKAYSLGYLSPVSLNRDMVKDKEKILRSIARDLGNIRHPEKGTPILDKVHRPTDIGSGPHKKRLPDLMALFDNFRIIGKGYSHEDIKGVAQEGRGVIYPSRETGTHAPNGIFMTTNNKKAKVETVNDVAPYILSLFGL